MQANRGGLPVIVIDVPSIEEMVMGIFFLSFRLVSIFVPFPRPFPISKQTRWASLLFFPEDLPTMFLLVALSCVCSCSTYLPVF